MSLRQRKKKGLTHVPIIEKESRISSPCLTFMRIDRIALASSACKKPDLFDPAFKILGPRLRSRWRSSGAETISSFQRGRCAFAVAGSTSSGEASHRQACGVASNCSRQTLRKREIRFQLSYSSWPWVRTNYLLVVFGRVCRNLSF